MGGRGVQNGVICTRWGEEDPSGLAATSPREGRSFGGKSLERGGVFGGNPLRGEELLWGIP